MSWRVDEDGPTSCLELSYDEEYFEQEYEEEFLEDEDEDDVSWEGPPPSDGRHSPEAPEQREKTPKVDVTRDRSRSPINFPVNADSYRKKLRKIANSKRPDVGSDEVRKPTFNLRKFLEKMEAPVLDNVSSEVNSNCEKENCLVSLSNTNKRFPTKLRKNSGTQIELINSSLLSQPSVSPQQDVNPLALVWSDKLNSLNTTQKLYAEKAINDILFEAQLNNLQLNQKNPTSTRVLILNQKAQTGLACPIIIKRKPAIQTSIV